MFRWLCVAALGAVAILLIAEGGAPAGKTGLGALHVPPGFRVEMAAGPDLVNYPMMGTLDERGRLFLCESSGKNVTNEQMSSSPEFRIRMLEDVNGDGVYDRSTVFAEHLTLPAGAVWYRGSLYVASPPDLLRFDDLDGDGVADRRVTVVTGWTLSSNAASLHGPFFGPDGFLYLTDGRHGFDIQAKEGARFKGLASRIWRVRPDGSGLEWIAGGGFDNPVELIFTPAGETIGTMTYFTDPRDGQRDALLHFVEGGVYPKWHPAASEFKRTGELMPVMTKFARIAPAGLARYRGAAFGPRYQGNLFSAQFNPHRVQRHVLIREGATFRTEDSDFLTSADPDFHPTDVMEDADGSLLVVDTGAWFIHGCPISRISKPEFKGAIYRIRKIGAPLVKDARGQASKVETMPDAALANLLDDRRPAVRDRALELLVERGSVAALAGVRAASVSPEVRAAAVFGLGRIGTANAAREVRAALADRDFVVRIAAARMAGLAKDQIAVDRLMEMVRHDHPAARRQAATALGQIGEERAAPALIAAAATAEDRFVEHSIIYSLIQLRAQDAALPALTSRSPKVRKAALIALDQMEGSPLRSEQLAPFFRDPNPDLRSAALWVVSFHPGWSDEVLKFLRTRLSAPAFGENEAGPVRQALLSFCADKDVQAMMADLLPRRPQFLLDAMDRCAVKEFPQAWAERLGSILDGSDNTLRLRAVAMIRSRGLGQFDSVLRRMAANPAQPATLRVSALSALVTRDHTLNAASYEFLVARLQTATDAPLRLAAAQVLGRAELTSDQLLTLARRYLPRADALIFPSLLDAFRGSHSEPAGAALVATLLKSQSTIGESVLKQAGEILQDYPDQVRHQARPLLARLDQLQKSRAERLKKLEPLLTAGGDIGRGRRVFFGEKVACSSCHTIGQEGGHVGPDLTAIGAIRSGPDLLESIVFPSASFVPGHEVYNVVTPAETYAGVIGSRTADLLVLITGPNGEVRIPSAQIRSMKRSDVSLMPDGLDESLTRSEFADLLFFLQSQKTR